MWLKPILYKSQCIRFLMLLQQIIASLVDENSTYLLSCHFEDYNSKIGHAGLIPCLIVPFIFKTSICITWTFVHNVTSHLLIPASSFLSLSYKGPGIYIGHNGTFQSDLISSSVTESQLQSLFCQVGKIFIGWGLGRRVL